MLWDMSHWVGVSKGLCEINWKNVTHLDLLALLLFHHLPTGKFLSRKALAAFWDALALSVWELLKLFVKRLVRGKLRSGELADDQLAKLAVEPLCKIIARPPHSQPTYLTGKGLNVNDFINILCLKRAFEWWFWVGRGWRGGDCRVAN